MKPFTVLMLATFVQSPVSCGRLLLSGIWVHLAADGSLFVVLACVCYVNTLRVQFFGGCGGGRVDCLSSVLCSRCLSDWLAILLLQLRCGRDTTFRICLPAVAFQYICCRCSKICKEISRNTTNELPLFHQCTCMELQHSILCNICPS